MLHPNPNMLLRIAQGDAYGMSTEYCERHPDEPEYHELREFVRYLPHPIHSILPGSYTDDTQMSISIAETLITYKDDLHQGVFGTGFFNAFKRDMRDGYTRGFQRILMSSKNWHEAKCKLHGTSIANGAAMRSVPIGVIADPKRVISVATLQAKITHDSREGIISACAVALMSHFALYQSQDFSHLYEWCVKQFPDFALFEQPWDGPVQGGATRGIAGTGVITAWAVCTLLREQHSLLDIMRQIIDWGGDTDTVAAIAWGIASTRYQDEALPEFFERDLEAFRSPAYGAKFLKRLGQRLMEAYK